MKHLTVLTGIAVAILFVGVALVGDTLAQCNTAAGCGDPNCSACANKVKESSAESCASSCAANTVAISLDKLTPAERKLVKHLADLVEKDKQVPFDAAAFSKATGLSRETIIGFDQDRIHGGLMAELNSRGFDPSTIAFSTGGGQCAEFGACSVDRNLMGASGDLLESYQAERATDGKAYLAWKAPDFTLPTTDGREVTLSDYKGKPVAVALLAIHCNHCVDTAPMLSKLTKKYGDDIEILPVVINAPSVDTPGHGQKTSAPIIRCSCRPTRACRSSSKPNSCRQSC